MLGGAKPPRPSDTPPMLGGAKAALPWGHVKRSLQRIAKQPLYIPPNRREGRCTLTEARSARDTP